MSAIIRYSQDGNSRAKIEIDEWGNLCFRRDIKVDPKLIEFCRRSYEASKTASAGDCLGSFAQIPDDLYFDWLSEGFDATEEKPHVICAKLRAEDLGFLITNAKAELTPGA